VAAWQLEDARVTEFSTESQTDGSLVDVYAIDFQAIQYRYTTDTGDIVVRWDRSTGETTIVDNSDGGQLVLLTGNPALLVPVTGLRGDYNQDGTVGAADYVVWRNHEGTSFALPNRNPSLTGDVGPADYDFWVAHFSNSNRNSFVGHALAGFANPIPEPNTFALLAIGIVELLMLRKSQRASAKTVLVSTTRPGDSFSHP
jgi:hypothetical protein